VGKYMTHLKRLLKLSIKSLNDVIFELLSRRQQSQA
jgi:hypothetical protein